MIGGAKGGKRSLVLYSPGGNTSSTSSLPVSLIATVRTSELFRFDGSQGFLEKSNYCLKQIKLPFTYYYTHSVFKLF